MIKFLGDFFALALFISFVFDIFLKFFPPLVQPVIFRCPLKRERVCVAFSFLKSGPLRKLMMTKVSIQNSISEYFLLKRPSGQWVVLRGPYCPAAVQQSLLWCLHAHSPGPWGALAMAATVPHRGHSPLAWQEIMQLTSSPITVPCAIARGSAASDFENNFHEVLLKMSRWCVWSSPPHDGPLHGSWLPGTPNIGKFLLSAAKTNRDAKMCC